MTPRLLLLPLAFALVATVTFAAAEGEEASAAEKEMVLDPSTGKMVTAPEYGGTITFGSVTEPANSDPWQGHVGQVAWMFTNEKLGIGDWAIDRQRFGFQSGYLPLFAIAGELAESWEWTDPVTLAVRIRSGVHWHDKAPMNGRELTAKDVEYNWHRYLGLGSGYTEGSPIVAQQSQLDDIGIESVTATDDHTVVFRLKEPNFAAERTILYHYTSVGSDRSALSSFDRWVSPARPPNRTCDSHRIRLSMCSCRRCAWPRCRNPLAPKSITFDRYRGRTKQLYAAIVNCPIGRKRRTKVCKFSLGCRFRSQPKIRQKAKRSTYLNVRDDTPCRK